MTIIWDDDGDGTVYDHNGHEIGTIDPEKPYVYPSDVQTLVSDVWREEADLGNSPVMSIYAGELLIRKVDGDIARTSDGHTVPS